MKDKKDTEHFPSAEGNMGKSKDRTPSTVGEAKSSLAVVTEEVSENSEPSIVKSIDKGNELTCTRTDDTVLPCIPDDNLQPPSSRQADTSEKIIRENLFKAKIKHGNFPRNMKARRGRGKYYSTNERECPVKSDDKLSRSEPVAKMSSRFSSDEDVHMNDSNCSFENEFKSISPPESEMTKKNEVRQITSKPVSKLSSGSEGSLENISWNDSFTISSQLSEFLTPERGILQMEEAMSVPPKGYNTNETKLDLSLKSQSENLQHKMSTPKPKESPSTKRNKQILIKRSDSIINDETLKHAASKTSTPSRTKSRKSTRESKQSLPIFHFTPIKSDFIAPATPLKSKLVATKQSVSSKKKSNLSYAFTPENSKISKLCPLSLQYKSPDHIAKNKYYLTKPETSLSNQSAVSDEQNINETNRKVSRKINFTDETEYSSVFSSLEDVSSEERKYNISQISQLSHEECSIVCDVGWDLKGSIIRLLEDRVGVILANNCELRDLTIRKYRKLFVQKIEILLAHIMQTIDQQHRNRRHLSILTKNIMTEVRKKMNSRIWEGADNNCKFEISYVMEGGLELLDPGHSLYGASLALLCQPDEDYVQNHGQ